MFCVYTIGLYLIAYIYCISYTGFYTLLDFIALSSLSVCAVGISCHRCCHEWRWWVSWWWRRSGTTHACSFLAPGSVGPVWTPLVLCVSDEVGVTGIRDAYTAENIWGLFDFTDVLPQNAFISFKQQTLHVLFKCCFLLQDESFCTAIEVSCKKKKNTLEGLFW